MLSKSQSHDIGRLLSQSLHQLDPYVGMGLSR